MNILSVRETFALGFMAIALGMNSTELAPAAALLLAIFYAGLDTLIQISIPVLIAVYLPFIMLIMMNFVRHKLS